MKYMPNLAIRRTKGPPMSPGEAVALVRESVPDDPLYLFGRLLHLREMEDLERKYGKDRRGNVIRVRRASGFRVG
jgi:hypothetical protein